MHVLVSWRCCLSQDASILLVRGLSLRFRNREDSRLCVSLFHLNEGLNELVFEFHLDGLSLSLFKSCNVCLHTSLFSCYIVGLGKLLCELFLFCLETLFFGFD